MMQPFDDRGAPDPSILTPPRAFKDPNEVPPEDDEQDEGDGEDLVEEQEENEDDEEPDDGSDVLIEDNEATELVAAYGIDPRNMGDVDPPGRRTVSERFELLDWIEDYVNLTPQGQSAEVDHIRHKMEAVSEVVNGQR